MATFNYTALDKTDSYVKGKIDARNNKKALSQLEKEGFLVINIKREKTSAWQNLTLLSTVKRLDKIFFTRHLYTMLESGISLDQAIKISAEQTTNHKFKSILFDVYEKVRKGQSLNSALSTHQKYFSSFFINLVKVGEKSGTLDDTLLHLLEQQEQDYELITKTRGAMIYPAVIISAAVAIVILMMTFVIPNITGILLEYQVELPLTTKILIFFSNFLLKFGLVVAFVAIILAYLLYRWTRKSPGKKYWDLFKLNIPLLKNIVVEFNLARFSRSMSSLLKSCVAIDEALQLSASVSGNIYYQNSIRSGINIVRKGVPLTQVLSGYPKLYPPISTRMLEVGEKTGKFDHMFTRLAIFYEKSVLNTVSNLSSVIEPLLLLAIGVGVGFIAVSVLSPIWKFAQTI